MKLKLETRSQIIQSTQTIPKDFKQSSGVLLKISVPITKKAKERITRKKKNGTVHPSSVVNEIEVFLRDMIIFHKG